MYPVYSVVNIQRIASVEVYCAQGLEKPFAVVPALPSWTNEITKRFKTIIMRGPNTTSATVWIYVPQKDQSGMLDPVS